MLISWTLRLIVQVPCICENQRKFYQHHYQNIVMTIKNDVDDDDTIFYFCYATCDITKI